MSSRSQENMASQPRRTQRLVGIPPLTQRSLPMRFLLTTGSLTTLSALMCQINSFCRLRRGKSCLFRFCLNSVTSWLILWYFCDVIIIINYQLILLTWGLGWVGLWGFLWWAPSAKRKDHHRVSSGWSSAWHHSNTGLSSTQYEQIPIILGVWPFWLTQFFFRSITFWRAYGWIVFPLLKLLSFFWLTYYWFRVFFSDELSN